MTPAVQFQDVSFAYTPGIPVLENITLSVNPGELLAIVGPNGGGKSTLLKIMLGLLDGSTGQVSVLGMSPHEAQRAGVIGWVAQKSEAQLSFPLSARAVVEMGASRAIPGWRATPRDVRDHVEKALAVVGASEYADRPIGRLSGGQLQRVMIARALASGAKVLALDEPLVGIDAVGQQRFAELIRKLHRELGLTILLVSHDLRTVAGGAATCDRVACLRRRLHFHAAPHGITPQVLAEVFQHDLAGVFGDVHIDAHKASECASHDHNHEHAHSPTPVQLGITPTQTPASSSQDPRPKTQVNPPEDSR